MTSPLADALSLQQPIIPASKANIAPTDVLGAYQMATNQANQQYLAKLQQQNSLWGGLAGLGGSALTASILKGNLFGPAASTAASTAGTAAAPAAASGAVPLASNALDSTMLGYGANAAGAGGTAAAAGAPLDLAALGGGADAAGTGLADAGAGTVAGDIAASGAADAAAGVGAAGAADAGGMTLADLLPFLFAA